MKTIVHQFFDCLRIFGLRDRLRCPECKAVGTYKPHGGWFDTSDIRKVRRWMCKWCGYYRGPEGQGKLVAPNLNKKCWDFVGDTSPTPARILAVNLRGVWPWRG